MKREAIDSRTIYRVWGAIAPCGEVEMRSPVGEVEMRSPGGEVEMRSPCGEVEMRSRAKG